MLRSYPSYSLRPLKVGPDLAIVEISGYLNHHVKEDLARRIGEIEQLHPEKLVLDCSYLLHMDSSVLGYLVELHQRFTASSRELLLRWVPDNVMRVLEISRMNAFLNVEPDRRKRTTRWLHPAQHDPILGELKRCWDMFGCECKDCPHYGTQTYVCWLTPHTPCKSVISRDFNKELASCIHCEVFRNNINQYTIIQEDYLKYVREAEKAYLNLLDTKLDLEQKSEHLRGLFGTLFDETTDAVVIFETHTGQIYSANRQATDLLGLAELKDTIYSVYDFCADLRITPPPWEVNLLRSDSHHRRWQQVWVCENGQRHHMEVTFSPLDTPREGMVLMIGREIPAPSPQLVSEQQDEDDTNWVTSLEMSIERVTSNVSLNENLDGYVNLLVETFVDEIPPAEAAMILLFDETGSTLCCQSAMGYPHIEKLFEFRIPRGLGLPGVLPRNLWGNFVEEIPMLDEFHPHKQAGELCLEQMESALVLPLEVGATKLGFGVLHAHAPNAFRGFPHDKIRDSLSRASQKLEQIKIQSELQRWKHFHTNLFEALPCPAMQVTANGYLVAVNSRARSLCSQSTDNLLGKHLQQVFQIAVNWWQEVCKTVAGCHEWKGTVDLNTDGDQKQSAYLEIVLLPSTGMETARYLFLMESLSERSDIDQYLLRTQRMEALGVMAGGVAHDINNLLVGVLGYAGLIKETLPEDNALKRYLGIIENSCEQASNLTRRLLSYARETPEEFGPANVNQLIESIIQLFRPNLGHEIKLELTLLESPLYAEVSPSSFQQAVLNLCINAAEAMEGQDGTLSVSTEKKDDDQGHSWVVVRVTDTGCGIAPEIHTDIFKPFFTTKPSGAASGLGLGIVRRIVSDHHGKIHFETGPEGTSFKVSLPSVNPSLRSGPKPSQQMIDANTPKKPLVLVVDDEALVLELVSSVLLRDGIDVHTAANGLEGLQLFEKAPAIYSAMIVDLVMPEMSGEELINRVRKINPEIPILVSSGYSLKPAVDSEIRAGQLSFLPKPYRRNQLLEAVRSLLGDDNEPAPAPAGPK